MACFTWLIIFILLIPAVQAQTGCGTVHAEPGAFICYPNPSEHPEDVNVPAAFHVSAQANAPRGRGIARYVLLIDDRKVYEIRLLIPVERLSIETNVKSPFISGSHTLRLVVDGTGSAESGDLKFHSADDLGLCDSFNRVDPRTCLLSNARGPLRWSVQDKRNDGGVALVNYLDYLHLYGQNLTSLEADVADAFATDAQGNLYTASHWSADIEVRKYAPSGSLIYDNLVRACGPGFLSIAAMAVDDHGNMWIAGNTTACIPITPKAFKASIEEPWRTHGFVMRLDSNRATSDGPAYVTYISAAESRITALRVDAAGNAYVAGISASTEFPHDGTFTVGENPRNPPSNRIGFLSVLNSSGAALLWSTLLLGGELNALAIDKSGNAYVTGRAASRQLHRSSDDVLVAALSNSGHTLSYLTLLGSSGIEEGQQISVNSAGDWVLVGGETNSNDFSRAVAGNARQPHIGTSFIVALQPCSSNKRILAGMLSASIMAASPQIARQFALDAFSGTFSRPLAPTKSQVFRQTSMVQVASPCSSPARN